ncbi:MAG: hypothetical protein KJ015_18950 [Myxococcales bacterium]|nr:hypothetical protein [Myxococcales bacterium]
MSTQSRLASAFVLALLGLACASDPARSAPSTVVLPEVSPDPSPSPETPPRRQAQPAPASPSDAARAEELFRHGRTLMEQGKYAEACEAFAESMRFDPALGTLLNLATCVERSGDTQRACSLFAQARDMAHEKGSVEREKFVATRLSQLGCP